jgi:tape measure domain-containing protein
MANNELKYKITLADLFSGKMASATRSAEKMDATMSGLGSKLKNVAIGLGVAGLGKELLDVGTKFDSYQMRLKTLLGSQEAASAAFEQIKKDAATTPFDVSSLTQANSLLISAGLSAGQARLDVLGLGNAIAATGGGEDELSRMAVNMQQIKNLGKATALDIKQFAFAGIPIYKLLADATGKSMAQVKEMDVTYEQLTSAFAKASEKGGMFYEGLANQSKTVGGQISNLKDKFSFFLYDLYNKARPAIIGVINMLSGLIDVVQRFLPLIKMGITLWGAYIIKVRLARIESFQFALAQRAMAMGMSKSAIAMGFLKRGIQGIGSAIKAVPIIGWIAAIVEGIQYLWDTFSGFREAVYGFIETFKVMGDVLSLQFQGVGKIIKGAITGNSSAIKEGMILVAQAAAIQLNAGNKGIQKGKKSFAESQGGGLASSDLAGIGGKTAPGAAGGGGGGLGSASEISSARPQSIIINVNDGLVKQMTIQTTNLTEGSAKIKEAVSIALMEALNDANAMAKA